MGSVYRRGDSPFLWLGYTDTSGRRRLESSGTADESQAKERLAARERQVAAETAAGAKSGSPTLRWYVEERWLKERAARKMRSGKQDAWRLERILPALGGKLLKDVTRADVLRFMRDLRADKLAPRSERLVYAGLRVIFADAVADELVPFSPCTLRQRRGELPKSQDKDPAWREAAVFTRAEVEQLISDERLGEFHRALWGTIFLGGLRIGEALPRRWRDLDARREPLSGLEVRTHWDSEAKVEVPGTKGDPRGRAVPVHPTLGVILANWKLSGWARAHGRPPKDEDFIFKSPRGQVLNRNTTWKWLAQDCAALGLRRRRQHDTRATFITLALDDGAQKDILQRVTHGAPGDIISAYSRFPWASLCEQVRKLRVGLLTGRAVHLPATRPLRLEETGMETMPSPEVCANARKGSRPLSAPHRATQGTGRKGGTRARQDAEEPGVTPQRSDVAAEPNDYEDRARALGFTVVYPGGGR